MATKTTDRPNPAKQSLKQEQAEQRETARRKGGDNDLTEALEDTFPASDPVAAQTASKPGAKKRG